MENAIVLIDSGVDKEIFFENVLDSVEIVMQDSKAIVQQSSNDLYGHGTAAMYEILSICPWAKVFSIRILDSEGKTSLEHLLAALEYCKQIDIKIINMSIAITNITTSGEERLVKKCEELKEQKKILLSSVRNNSTSSLPASLDSVLGVRGAFFADESEFWFNPGREVQCVANCTPIVTNRNLKNFLFFGGNSKACVNMASKLLCLLEKVPTDIVPSELLNNNKKKGEWNEDDIMKTEVKKMTKTAVFDEMAYRKIIDILQKISPENHRKIEWDDNLFEKNVLAMEQFPQILFFLEKIFAVKIEDKVLSISSFSSMSSMYYLVKQAQVK